ncbi:hypothetical protein M7I_6743 [Glarea lozoyensis 74030]|uniref:Uncharacterized protein n=1 Tax=Glarea lozoyensis (strain ATCC 74030 / MF5533) TaxID=1104152 RepID=H0EVE5_GLAL7|nr:hypothetical protein M7I_6743 [Glarea lozoyensis 74030]
MKEVKSSVAPIIPPSLIGKLWNKSMTGNENSSIGSNSTQS